jgi:hypothetical protein
MPAASTAAAPGPFGIIIAEPLLACSLVITARFPVSA